MSSAGPAPFAKHIVTGRVRDILSRGREPRVRLRFNRGHPSGDWRMQDGTPFSANRAEIGSCQNGADTPHSHL